MLRDLITRKLQATSSKPQASILNLQPSIFISRPPCLHVTLILIIALFFALSQSLCAQNNQPYVVMLSMDGFRWDYPDRWPTPNLDRIAAVGVKAESLQPSFPSKTFPNHYTIVTGLYPDHHGIVENSFFDPVTDRHYRISDRDAVEDGTFYGGEPIWVTAEKNGIKAASFFWVGSEAKIDGMRPTYWKRYEEGVTFTARIDTVIYWLDLPEKERPHLITFYMEEPDHTSHDVGPDDSLTMKTVMHLDSLVGIFIDKVSSLPIADEVNIIITSDHGMGSTSPDRSVDLKKYLDKDWFEDIEGHYTNLTMKVKPEYEEKAWKALSSIPHISAWKHGEVPDSLHYGTNPRTLDFIVAADSAWEFSTLSGKVTTMLGNHGYNPYYMNMHAIFYAVGPAFKSGYIEPTFENVNIYPLICNILGIKPAPNDGDIKNVKGMLKE